MFELAHGWDDIDQRLRKTGLAIEPGTTRWIDLIVAHLEDKHSRIEELEAQLAAIEEYGTEEINEAVALRQKLARALEALEFSLDALNGFVDSGDAFDSILATLADLKGELK